MTPQSNPSDARRLPAPPAPTIASLPPAEQFDEALGRLRDVAEWLNGLFNSDHSRSRNGVVMSLSVTVDDAANDLDRAETIVREAATCPA